MAWSATAANAVCPTLARKKPVVVKPIVCAAWVVAEVAFVNTPALTRNPVRQSVAIRPPPAPVLTVNPSTSIAPMLMLMPAAAPTTPKVLPMCRQASGWNPAPVMLWITSVEVQASTLALTSAPPIAWKWTIILAAGAESKSTMKSLPLNVTVAIGPATPAAVGKQRAPLAHCCPQLAVATLSSEFQPIAREVVPSVMPIEAYVPAPTVPDPVFPDVHIMTAKHGVDSPGGIV